MTTKEFLDRYDNNETFTEDELCSLWWDDLIDDCSPMLMREVETSEPHRWNTPQDKVIQIENRCFMVSRFRGNTEYQEDYYDVQPQEVYPIEKVITVWERVD